MATDAGADDDTSSSGMDNPGYDNDQVPLETFRNGGSSLPSPVKHELGRQSELLRDNSVIEQDMPHGRLRRAGKNPERPGLSRLVSDLSDVSNSTTSTIIPPTPIQQRSEPDLNERL